MPAITYTGPLAGSRSGISQSHRLGRSGNPSPNVGSGHLLRSVDTSESACTAASLLIPIGGYVFSAAVNSGEVNPPNGLAGFSLQAALLSNPIRKPATLPVVMNFGLRVPALRLRIAPVPAVLCVCAGPAKGSVFQKVGQFFKSLFHVPTMTSESERDAPQSRVSGA